MLRRPTGLVAWLCLLGTALTAIVHTANVYAGGCVSDDECKGERVCREGACVDAPVEEQPEPDPGGCAADADCKGGRSCVAAVCVQACTMDTECPGEEICKRDLCILETACTMDTECPGEWVCASDICAPPEQAAPATLPAPPPATPRAPAAPPPSLAPAMPAPAAPRRPPPPPPFAAPDEPTEDGSGSSAMFVTGLATFGSTWLSTIAITAAASEGSVTGDATELAAIPIVGPFIMSDQKRLTETGEIVYPVVGILQIVGVGFTVWGATDLGGDDEPQARDVTLAPAVGPGRYGLTVEGTF